jgi:hypothetical protein
LSQSRKRRWISAAPPPSRPLTPEPQPLAGAAAVLAAVAAWLTVAALDRQAGAPSQ